MTPEEWKALGAIAGGVTGTSALLAWVWALMTGRLWTSGSHQEAKDSEQRAWNMVAKLTDARSQDNAVLEKLSERVHDMANIIERLQSTIENNSRQRR